MSENLHNIDDLFRRGLGDDEAEPSAGVWENIDSNLDKRSVIHINQKYRRVKRVAAASLIMVAALAMYTIYTRKINNKLVKEKKEKVLKEGKTSNSRLNATDTANFPASINANKSLVKAPTPKPESLSDNAATKSGEKIDQENIKFNKAVSARKSVNNKSLQNSVLTTKSRITKKQPFEDNSIVGSSNSERSIQQYLGDKSSNGKTAFKNKNEAERLKTITQDTANISANTSPSTTISIIDKDEISNLLAVEPNQIDLSEHVVAGATMRGKQLQPLNNTPEVNAKPIKIAKNINSKSKTGFSATAFYSPDVVSARVQKDRPRFREDDRNEIKKDEDTKVSSTIGLLVNYNFNNWSIGSGLTYFTRETDIRSKTIYARPDARGDVKYRFNSSVGYSYVSFKTSPTSPASGDSIRTISSNSRLQYIGLPLTVRYNFGLGRFSLSPGVGVSANFLTKGAIETSIVGTNGRERARITDIQGLKNSYFSGAISISASYKINETFALSVTPTNRFALTSINRNAPVKTYLNSTGFAAGLSVSF